MFLTWCVLLELVLFLCSPHPVQLLDQCACAIGGANYGKSSQQNCGVCHDDQISVQLTQSDQQTKSVLEIKRPYWIGFSVGFNDLVDFENNNGTNQSIFGNDSVVGICRFCSLFNGYNFAVSESVILYEDNHFVNRCRNNADGFLCSQCEEGYYHNMGMTCVHKCDQIGWDWVLFILSQFVPIVFFFFVFLFANFSLISGPLNAAIFFAQMISTTMDLDQESFPLANITDSESTAKKLTAVYKFLYGPFNLDFFAPFTDDLCMFRKRTYLYYFIAKYIVAIFPLMLVSIIVFLYSMKRCNAANFEKLKQSSKFFSYILPANFDLTLQSSRNVLASFVFLAYIKFSWISTILVTPIPLYNYDNKIDRFVLYLDPTVSYFDQDGVGIAVVAFICLIFIILLPTILLLFRYNTIRRGKLWFLRIFLEPFQYSFIEKTIEEDLTTSTVQRHVKHCFNTDKYPWMSGAYLLLRILMLLIFFDTKIIRRLILQQVVCIIGAIFFILVQPYKSKKWINKLDALMFLLLGFINTLTLYQYYLAIQSQPLNLYAFVVQYFLTFVPLFWMLYYLIFTIQKRLKQKLVPSDNVDGDSRRDLEYTTSFSRSTNPADETTPLMLSTSVQYHHSN